MTYQTKDLNILYVIIITNFFKKNEVTNIKLHFIQLRLDLFTDPRIRKLKQPRNGYVMLVIYLRLLTLSLTYDGYIIYDTHFSSLTEQLSFALNDEQEADIEATIAYCVALGLIQIIGLQQQLFFTDFVAMTSPYKQSTFINKPKELKKLSNTPGAIRQRRYRANKKRKLEEKK